MLGLMIRTSRSRLGSVPRRVQNPDETPRCIGGHQRGSIVESREGNPPVGRPEGFPTGFGEPPEGAGRHGLPSTHRHFPEAVQWESGICAEKGKSQQIRRSVGLSLITTYPAALTPKPTLGQPWMIPFVSDLHGARTSSRLVGQSGDECLGQHGECVRIRRNVRRTSHVFESEGDLGVKRIALL
jgi:hypothetical protein